MNNDVIRFVLVFIEKFYNFLYNSYFVIFVGVKLGLLNKG